MIDRIQNSNFTAPLSPHQQSGQKLTEEQQETIKNILSRYEPDSITKESAKAINEAFREAGIKPGAELRRAINEAGFNAEKLRRLAPPFSPVEI